MAEIFPGLLPNEFLDKLPPTTFKGKITLVENTDNVEEACSFLSRQSFIGFDTETRPSFKKGKVNKVSLLQLSTSDMAFLFRLNHIGLPDKIVSILSDEKIIKVGLAIRDDINQLKKLTPFEPKNFIELQSMVEEFGIEEKSLKKLSAIVLKIRITKGQQTSNWENPILTEAQQIYAATDAWACYEIYKKLIEEAGKE